MRGKQWALGDGAQMDAQIGGEAGPTSGLVFQAHQVELKAKSCGQREAILPGSLTHCCNSIFLGVGPWPQSELKENTLHVAGTVLAPFTYNDFSEITNNPVHR